jgi:hypothetical protein
MSNNAKAFRQWPLVKQVTKTLHQVRQIFTAAGPISIGILLQLGPLRPMLGSHLRWGFARPSTAVTLNQRIRKMHWYLN